MVHVFHTPGLKNFVPQTPRAQPSDFESVFTTSLKVRCPFNQCLRYLYLLVIFSIVNSEDNVGYRLIDWSEVYHFRFFMIHTNIPFEGCLSRINMNYFDICLAPIWIFPEKVLIYAWHTNIKIIIFCFWNLISRGRPWLFQQQPPTSSRVSWDFANVKKAKRMNSGNKKQKHVKPLSVA